MTGISEEEQDEAVWEGPQNVLGHAWSQLRITLGFADRVEYFGGLRMVLLVHYKSIVQGCYNKSYYHQKEYCYQYRE